jgi:non-heme chloroperoxidase
MPDFDSSGVRLFHTDWGAGPPAVFTHSWGFNSDMWSYQVPALVDGGVRCVAYDRRGHGRSDRPGSGYDFDTLADDLAALLDRLDLREVTLVGHSMGAGEIVRYLSRHGTARVARVVFIAPTTPMLMKSEDHPEGIDRALLDANRAAFARDVPRWCHDNAPPFFGSAGVSPGMTDWLTRQIVDTPLKILLDTLRTNSEADFRAELGAFALPTLILHGDADASAPLDLTGRATHALIRHSRLVVYEGAGHGLFAHEHPRINRDLLTFIRG